MRHNNGPPPKNPGKRARTNADPIPHRNIAFDTTKPSHWLPDIEFFEWHERTHKFWRELVDCPLTDDCSAVDWEFLLDTAMLHTEWCRYHKVNVAAELRQRLGLFGFTPADRARLRIFNADADRRDDEAKARVSRQVEKDVAREYGDLRAVD